MAIAVRQFLEAGRQSLLLEVMAGEAYLDRPIQEESLNRPGLALAGFFQRFAYRRIQVLGGVEQAYLKSLSAEERSARVRRLFRRPIPCVVAARGLHVFSELKRMADEFHVPALKSSLSASRFIHAATMVMENLRSPHMRAQGTMVDIKGVGVLLEGEPGIGKSETALALIKAGHSLVADDSTVLRRDSAGAIIGSAIEITHYHMEIRGLGIIHVPSLFGVASVRGEMRLDLIVRLHRSDLELESDRAGLARQTRDVLGVKIPVVAIPAAVGLDLARVVEVAALNERLKQLGYDAAKELDEKLVSALTQKKIS